jgi:hypothetical protein
VLDVSRRFLRGVNEYFFQSYQGIGTTSFGKDEGNQEELQSSFLDIFCHEYGYIDWMSAQAWPTVWEEWRQIDVASAPSSPCDMDFILYRIGKEYCKDNLAKYACENGHEFRYFGGRLGRCRVCQASGKRGAAHPISGSLPCQADVDDLPREDGKLLLDDKNLLSVFDGVCIFEQVCQPKANTFQILDPPKSISIKGQTSWTNSMADRDRGGGGMMG